MPRFQNHLRFLFNMQIPEAYAILLQSESLREYVSQAILLYPAVSVTGLQGKSNGIQGETLSPNMPIQPHLPPHQLLSTSLTVWLWNTSVAWLVLFFPPEMPTPYTFCCQLSSARWIPFTPTTPAPRYHQTIFLFLGFEVGDFHLFMAATTVPFYL